MELIAKGFVVELAPPHAQMHKVLWGLGGKGFKLLG